MNSVSSRASYRCKIIYNPAQPFGRPIGTLRILTPFSDTHGVRDGLMCRARRGEGVVYATRGLLDALLELARDRDPTRLTVSIATTQAAELGEEAELDPETAVFTDLYLPETGGSVSAVFGMDLGTPRASGRFLSHPDGYLGVRQTDDLHEVVIVAVPPYDRSSVAAFDRRGKGLALDVVDVEPPQEPFGP